jgi:hypothetical protein
MVYNINKGRNAEMASRSPALDGYETFIAEIKDNLNTMGLPDAIKIAVRNCMSKNILVSFLKEHGSEVENMLLTEWNMADALEVRYEEGVATGEARGVEKAWEKARKEIFSLLRQGYSVDETEKMLAKRET